MRVAGVRTSTGETVALLFVDGGVHVIDTMRRSRVLRAAGGGVFAAIGLAEVGLGIGHAVNLSIGAGLSIAGLVLAAVGGLVAATAWALAAHGERTLRNATAAPTIAAEAVTWARSRQQHGQVIVSLGLAGGAIREFSAAGMAGTQLAHQFRILFGVEDSPDARAAIELDAPTRVPPDAPHHG